MRVRITYPSKSCLCICKGSFFIRAEHSIFIKNARKALRTSISSRLIFYPLISNSNYNSRKENSVFFPVTECPKVNQKKNCFLLFFRSDLSRFWFSRRSTPAFVGFVLRRFFTGLSAATILFSSRESAAIRLRS